MKGGLSDCAMSEEFWWLLIVLWLLDPSRMIGMAVGKALFVQFMEAAISAREILDPDGEETSSTLSFSTRYYQTMSTSLQCCRKGLSVTLLSTGAASSSRSTWVKPDKFGPPLPSPLWPLLLDTCGQWLGTLGSYWWSWWHFYILWDLYFEWIYQRVCSHCCCQCLLTCRCCCCKFLTVDFCTLFIWVKVWDSGWSIYTYAKQISDSGAFFDPKLIMIMKWFGKL